MTKPLHELTIHEALAGMRAGEFSSVALTMALLARIEAVDPQVKAYLTVTREQALAQAKTADERRSRGDEAPLLGAPLAIKDVLAT
jgi:aspartyl-tRNA(Asn)/glutamyl-tRNA(Gln) amidotransferase subunit A